MAWRQHMLHCEIVRFSYSRKLSVTFIAVVVVVVVVRKERAKRKTLSVRKRPKHNNIFTSEYHEIFSYFYMHFWLMLAHKTILVWYAV